jgi:hypothetical protein
LLSRTERKDMNSFTGEQTSASKFLLYVEAT